MPVTHTSAHRSSVFPPPFDAFLGELEALGVRAVTSGGESFTVVAARSNPRWWLIPRDRGAACARAGLEMFQPTTLAARLAKSALQFRTRYDRILPAGSRVIHLSGAPLFLAAFDQPGLGCAYFTGTDGPHRKTAVQIMSAKGDIVGYAKATANPLVKRYIENEARQLKAIARMGLTAAMVPTLIEHQNEHGVARLVTDTLRAPGHIVSKDFRVPHDRFLAELAAKTSHRGGVETLAELTRTLDALRPALSGAWSTRLSKGIARLAPAIAAMPVGLAHGDFTPWNTFGVADRLYVFDWEYAHPAYPLGFDRVHFTLSANPAKAVPALIDQLETDVASTLHVSDRAMAAPAVLMSLLLHAAFFLNRAIEAGGDENDWSEAERRADLIDMALTRIEG